MYCKNCGKQIPENSNWCPECGQDLRNIQPSQVVTPPQQPIYQQPIYQQPNTNDIDKPNIGLNILSLLFPIIGWILYFTYRDNKPKRAKACASCAWVGFAIGFIIGFIGGLAG